MRVKQSSLVGESGFKKGPSSEEAKRHCWRGRDMRWWGWQVGEDGGGMRKGMWTIGHGGLKEACEFRKWSVAP